MGRGLSVARIMEQKKGYTTSVVGFGVDPMACMDSSDNQSSFDIVAMHSAQCGCGAKGENRWIRLI